MTKQELNIITGNFVEGLKELFRDSLKGVILYGSYARGDFDEESDIDVAILVDVKENKFHHYRTLVSRAADRADWDYNTLLSPIMVNYAEFEKHKAYAPFYSKVDREGVRLLA